MNHGIFRDLRSGVKNAHEEVWAYIAPFGGHELAQIRVSRADKEDVMHPTKKGIAVRLDDLPRLMDAVRFGRGG